MDRIKRVVDPLKEKWSFQQRPEREWDRLWNHRQIRSFREKHPELDPDLARRSWLSLRQYAQERDHCETCPGLQRCPNLVKGHQPALQIQNHLLDLRMVPCHHKIAEDERKKVQQLIKSHHIPADILDATFVTMDFDEARATAIEAAINFCNQFGDGKPERGLYLYGPFGVGKSRIAAAMAHELVQYHVDSLMVYVPEFVREIKDSIRDGLVQDKLETLKTATVLILDDFGAENLTPWTRDEVIGAILQYRMAEKLPTVITSNLDLEELEIHLAHSDKGGTERTKAKRIMERILPFVDAYQVKGPNRR
ncbi:primosomal protein DnaI [Desmospora activa]|uniref:Replicative DNA helicase loader DnaI n=1 Tax=Desmospora activa DSM 45169 TaxID=1121389 RepID=A0A2T4Z8D2_9BACL|nr:primosomal protein DnaI [Desmospora activa]PTM58120.1 replicative DNA helicase loader DnaI [Desmospora activa DSM 45169]